MGPHIGLLALKTLQKIFNLNVLKVPSRKAIWIAQAPVDLYCIKGTVVSFGQWIGSIHKKFFLEATVCYW